jgi:hypothetical protein
VKLTSLTNERFKSGVGLGPIVVPLIGAQVNASVKAGGVTYYVLFQSFAQNGNKTRQVVTALGVSKKAVPTNACASNPNMTNAAGLAIYGGTLDGAPDRTRTCATGSGGRCSIR